MRHRYKVPHPKVSDLDFSFSGLKTAVLREVQKAVKAVADALGDTGRILVRESGTEPVIRVMVEAPTKDKCQKYVEQVVDVICQRGHARV